MFPYERAVAVWLAVAVVATAVSLARLAPGAWRPRGPLVPALCVVVAYLGVSVGYETGFVEWLDHDVFERMGGSLDDLAPWLIGAVTAAAVLTGTRLVQLVRRAR